MNFGQMKKALRQLVGRPDMSADRAGEYIQRAISNLERSPLRLGFQETSLHAVMDGASSALELPGDFLELIDLFTDQATYRQVDVKSFQRSRGDMRDPVFVKSGRTYVLKPVPPKGTMIHMSYYAEAAKVSVDDDENLWLKSGSEALLYTAARMASDDYQIEDGPRFQAQADREIQLLQDQDDSEESAGWMECEMPTNNIC